MAEHFLPETDDPRDAPAWFAPSEKRRLVGFYGVIAFLHALGWGLYLREAAAHPALVGLGLAAYLFGLRHAFDADHIAAIDDTVRFLLQKGREPLGVGFFFSLGHATVVLLLAIGVAFAATTVQARLPALRDVGGLVGAAVSGVFLWIVGVLNVRVLLDVLAQRRRPADTAHGRAHRARFDARRSVVDRLLGGRLERLISRSWQMYPLGLLFGLGFDTASEVALLTMTAGASAGDLPIAGVLSLPILFAAGMSVMDTTDGVLMCRAYRWAFVDPSRKIVYNVVTIGLSIAVALVIGTIELTQVVAHLLDLRAAPFAAVAAIDFGSLGYGIVALFACAWALSVATGRLRTRGQKRSGAK